MILIAGSLILPEGALEEVRPAMVRQIGATRAERGCIDYSCAVDVMNPQRLLIHERWESQAALDAHLQQPHVAAFASALREAGASMITLRVYETNEGRPLGG